MDSGKKKTGGFCGNIISVCYQKEGASNFSLLHLLLQKILEVPNNVQEEYYEPMDLFCNYPFNCTRHSLIPLLQRFQASERTTRTKRTVIQRRYSGHYARNR